MLYFPRRHAAFTLSFNEVKRLLASVPGTERFS